LRILKATPQSLREASKIIREGGLVVYPTDTVYGVGCNPFDEAAVRRLLAAKGRSWGPLPILASSFRRASSLAVFPAIAVEAARRHWPGPLTLILKARRPLPPPLLEAGGRVGVRVPNHPVALTLLRLCGGFLVGTSANITGEAPALEAELLDERLKGRVDLVIDGGRAPIGVSSTVVDLAGGEPRLVRKGSLDVDWLIG